MTTTTAIENCNKNDTSLPLKNELSKFQSNLSKLIIFTKQEHNTLTLKNTQYLITSQTNSLSCYFGTISQCRIFASCSNQDESYLIKVTELFLEYIQVCTIFYLDDDYPRQRLETEVVLVAKSKEDEESKYLIHDSLILALGIMRDLACGSGTIRKCIWSNIKKSSSSISIFLSLLIRFREKTNTMEKCTMEHMFTMATTDESNKHDDYDNNDVLMWKKEIRLWANVLGLLRNVTHSACNDYCCYFHSLNGTNELLHILTKWCASTTAINTNQEDDDEQHHQKQLHLPPAKVPTREPCFRAMSTILNICEKSTLVSNYISTFPNIVQLLVDCCYGSGFTTNTNSQIDNTKTKRKKPKYPVVHPALINILKCVQLQHGDGNQDSFKAEYKEILNGEEARKMLAQKRELERKKKDPTTRP